MSRILVSRSVASSGAFVVLPLLIGCWGDSRASTATLAEPDEELERSSNEEPVLDDVWLARIDDLPTSAEGRFDFDSAVDVDGHIRINVTDERATLRLAGTHPTLGPAVLALIPLEDSTVSALRTERRTGWLSPPEGTFVRGVAGGRTVTWEVARYALSIDERGLVHGSFDLHSGVERPGEHLEAFGHLLGSCDTISDDGVVRFVAHAPPGSLCEEVMSL